MKIYLVQYNICGAKPNKHLVKANNQKDAIDYVWNNFYINENENIDVSKGFELFRKKDLYATDIEKLFVNESVIHILI